MLDIKTKPCRRCGKEFQAHRPMQAVCSARCATGEAVAKRKADAAAEREQHKARTLAMKPIRRLIAEAQVAFNAYIRERDRGLPCICCGQPMSPDKPGGSVDAGHFRSRGAAPQLRFDERNCFAQRKGCNRTGGATYGAFRAGVVARIGEAAVQALEADNAPRKWTRDELVQLKRHYACRARELVKERERSAVAVAERGHQTGAIT